jgi:uncharacterized protein (TIGR03382 family)
MVTSRGWALLVLCLAGAAVAQPAVVPWQVSTPPQTTASSLVGDVAILPDGQGEPRCVVGTDPFSSGVVFYDLDGGVVASFLSGRALNADARGGLAYAHLPQQLVVVSSSTAGVLNVYGFTDGGLDAGEVVTELTGNRISLGSPACLAVTRRADAGLEAWVSIGTPTLAHVAFFETDDAGLGGARVDGGPDVTLDAPPSSLVIDDEHRWLFAAVPGRGLYRLNLDSPDASVFEPFDGGHAGGEVTSLALYPTDSRRQGKLLLALVPQTGTISVYDLRDGGMTWLSAFTQISPDAGQVLYSPSWLDVAPSPRAPHGLFVVQDSNFSTGENYHLTPWDSIASLLHLPVFTEPDAGADGGVDAGASDAGPSDAGADAGTPDGGAADGGTGGGSGGGTGGGGGGAGGAGGAGGGGAGGSGWNAGGGGSDAGAGCHCGGGPGALLPFSLVLLSLLRRRRLP